MSDAKTFPALVLAFSPSVFADAITIGQVREFAQQDRDYTNSVMIAHISGFVSGWASMADIGALVNGTSSDETVRRGFELTTCAQEANSARIIEQMVIDAQEEPQKTVMSWLGGFFIRECSDELDSYWKVALQRS
jgi:hypothetical protein